MPSLKGRRLTVYNIVSKLYIENTIEEAIDDFQISLSEAKAALVYCKNLNCQTDTDRIQYCDGCILRTIEEGWSFDKGGYVQTENQITISKNDPMFFLGNINQLEDEKFGKPGWVIANELYSLLLNI